MDNALNGPLFVFVSFHVVLINPLQGVVPGIPGLVAMGAVLLARALAVSIIVGGLDRTCMIRVACLGLTQPLSWGALRGGQASDPEMTFALSFSRSSFRV